MGRRVVGEVVVEWLLAVEVTTSLREPTLGRLALLAIISSSKSSTPATSKSVDKENSQLGHFKTKVSV